VIPSSSFSITAVSGPRKSLSMQYLTAKGFSSLRTLKAMRHCASLA
jgi:hypothetical protein